MSARYGSRTRSGESVSGFGQRAGGAGVAEIVASFSPSPAASSTPVTMDGIEYIVWTVTANTTATFVAPVTAVGEAYVVAGGGGGGSAPPNDHGGGGGAGGVRNLNFRLAAGPYPLTIGSGGSANTAGNPSSGFGVTSTGGGLGQGTSTASTGGSGGGGGNYGSRVAGTPGQGNAGGRSATAPTEGAGGGGGSGSDGYNFARYIPGAPVTYFARPRGGFGTVLQNWGPITGIGGGGGGGCMAGGPSIDDNSSQGGANPVNSGSGLNGTVNTGGGGGGGARPNNTGGSGGSGVVLIRYQRFQG